MSKLTAEQERRLAKLDALEAGGVDNWDGYDFALEEWRKENEIYELADEFATELSGILADAEVDEPAGPKCGYAIYPPEGAIENLFIRFAHKAINSQ